MNKSTTDDHLLELVFSCDQRRGFVKSSVVLRYHPKSLIVSYAYINNSSYGVIEINHGWKTVNRWQTEDEAKFDSNKYYTSVITDGTVDDQSYEQALIALVVIDIRNNAEPDVTDILIDFLASVAQGDNSPVLRQQPVTGQ